MGWYVILIGLVGAVSACQPPRSREGGFDSPNPAAKLYAIHHAGEARDTNAIAPLIEQLHSDDPAVRMYAINALDRITGRRMGYSPYAPPHQRHEAIQRWTEAYESGKIVSSASPD